MWVASKNEKLWHRRPCFYSRDECIANAKTELDYPFYLGRVSSVLTEEEVAWLFLRSYDDMRKLLDSNRPTIKGIYVLDISTADQKEMVEAVAKVLRENLCLDEWYDVTVTELITELTEDD